MYIYIYIYIYYVCMYIYLSKCLSIYYLAAHHCLACARQLSLTQPADIDAIM